MGTGRRHAFISSSSSAACAMAGRSSGLTSPPSTISLPGICRVLLQGLETRQPTLAIRWTSSRYDQPSRTQSKGGLLLQPLPFGENGCASGKGNSAAGAGRGLSAPEPRETAEFALQRAEGGALSK
ncbi:hypothetical protein RGUI_3189 [Rhodovulum sp. P5]|nr:hypothetical protein RGUI_3189 [Rhodovulum sp. P5]